MKLRLLMEEFVDTVKYKSFFRDKEEQINIFKNPNSKELKESSNKGVVRGIMFIDGNLYVTDGDLIHSEVLKVLAKKNITDINDFQKWNIQPAYFKRFLAVVSKDNFKEWKPAESYVSGGEFMVEDFKKHYKKYNELFSSKGFKLSKGILG